MSFHGCDILKKVIPFRTFPMQFEVSVVTLSTDSKKNSRFHRFSKYHLLVFFLIICLSIGGFVRVLYAVILKIQLETSIKLEQKRSYKLLAGHDVLDSYLSDLITNIHAQPEVPREVRQYCEISRASIFPVIDNAVIDNIKSIVKHIDKKYNVLHYALYDTQKDEIVIPEFICPTYGFVSSHFGMRTDPVFEGEEKHNGVDIAGKVWSQIMCAADGTVIFSGKKSCFGNVIIIDHNNSGYRTLYAHLQKSVVHVGDRVTGGEIIGYMGSTGKSTGPHLHYEVRINGKPVNPVPYLVPNDVAADYLTRH